MKLSTASWGLAILASCTALANGLPTEQGNPAQALELRETAAASKSAPNPLPQCGSDWILACRYIPDSTPECACATPDTLGSDAKLVQYETLTALNNAFQAPQPRQAIPTEPVSTAKDSPRCNSDYVLICRDLERPEDCACLAENALMTLGPRDVAGADNGAVALTAACSGGPCPMNPSTSTIWTSTTKTVTVCASDISSCKVTTTVVPTPHISHVWTKHPHVWTTKSSTSATPLLTTSCTTMTLSQSSRSSQSSQYQSMPVQPTTSSCHMTNPNCNISLRPLTTYSKTKYVKSTTTSMSTIVKPVTTHTYAQSPSTTTAMTTFSRSLTKCGADNSCTTYGTTATQPVWTSTYSAHSSISTVKSTSTSTVTLGYYGTPPVYSSTSLSASSSSHYPNGPTSSWKSSSHSTTPSPPHSTYSSAPPTTTGVYSSKASTSPSSSSASSKYTSYSKSASTTITGQLGYTSSASNLYPSGGVGGNETTGMPAGNGTVVMGSPTSGSDRIKSGWGVAVILTGFLTVVLVL